MNPRSIILILFALLFAGGTVYFANSWLNAQRNALSRTQARPQQVEAPEHAILVAKRPLPAGTFVRKEHLRWQAWPKAELAKSYVERADSDAQVDKQIAAFTGAVVRKGIAVGEPITTGRVVKPGERGFLAAVLHPDMRAVSVKVKDFTATAGFIFPGDRVDLLLTHTIKQGKIGRRASETVLTNIRVLAVDQRTDDLNAKAKAKVKTVTLEVTPKQVEMVNVARSLGVLSLSLRAVARADRTPSGEARGKNAGNGGTGNAESAAKSRATATIASTGGDDATVQKTAKEARQGPDEAIVPGRGTTYTWGNQVSRLLAQQDGPSVTILRGGSAQTVGLPGVSSAGAAGVGAAAQASGQILRSEKSGLDKLTEGAR